MSDTGGLARLGIPAAQSSASKWLVRGLVLAAIVAIIAGGVAFARSRRSTGPRFETARVERGDLVATVTATGTLRATNTVDVGAEVSGRVARVHADYNDQVTAEQVLVELDTDQLDASLREARANLSVAQAAIGVARTALEDAQRLETRAQALHGRGLAAEAELENARATVARARAELARAQATAAVSRATLERAESALGRAVIRSPIDGIVLSRTVEEGQTVAAQFQTPVLFQLAESLDRMELHIDVDEADIGRVRERQAATFTVDAYSDRTFQATIDSLRYAPRTVQGVVTYEGVLGVDNHERLLRPGMTATATIVTDRREGVLLVPNAALRFVPPQGAFERGRRGALPIGPLVWTEEGATPTPHTVRLIATDGTRSQIEGEGITEGMQVLVDVIEQP